MLLALPIVVVFAFPDGPVWTEKFLSTFLLYRLSTVASMKVTFGGQFDLFLDVVVYWFAKVVSHSLHKVSKNLGKPLCSCPTLIAASLLPALPEIVLFMFSMFKKFTSWNPSWSILKSTEGVSLQCLTSMCMNSHLQCQLIMDVIKTFKPYILMAHFICMLNLVMNCFFHHFLRYLISYKSWCQHPFLFLLCPISIFLSSVVEPFPWDTRPCAVSFRSSLFAIFLLSSVVELCLWDTWPCDVFCSIFSVRYLSVVFSCGTLSVGYWSLWFLFSIFSVRYLCVVFGCSSLAVTYILTLYAFFSVFFMQHLSVVLGCWTLPVGCFRNFCGFFLLFYLTFLMSWECVSFLLLFDIVFLISSKFLCCILLFHLRFLMSRECVSFLLLFDIVFLISSKFLCCILFFHLSFLMSRECVSFLLLFDIVFLISSKFLCCILFFHLRFLMSRECVSFLLLFDVVFLISSKFLCCILLFHLSFLMSRECVSFLLLFDLVFLMSHKFICCFLLFHLLFLYGFILGMYVFVLSCIAKSFLSDVSAISLIYFVYILSSQICVSLMFTYCDLWT